MPKKTSRDQSNLKIDKGTVLAIPVAAGRWVLGQIISPGTAFYLGISQRVFEEPLSAEYIADQKLELFTWTNDAEIYRGNWKNLGQHRVNAYPPLPEYKIEISGKMMVESFDGENLRDYVPAQDSGLGFRKIRSPLLVQDAARAALGFEDWSRSFDDMKIGVK